MRAFEVMCDSNFDLNREQRERFGLSHFFPLGDVVMPDGKSLATDPDYGNISQHEFFTLVADKKNDIHSAARGIEEYTTNMEKVLAAGSDLLIISLSKAMSATYNLFLMAKEALAAKYPERKVFVIDSGRYGAAQGLLAMNCAQLRDEGKSIEDVAAWAEENKHTIHQMGPLDDLFFLSKVGRISKGKAFFGTLAGVKPMGDFNYEGMTSILGNAKGLNQAFKATVEYIKKTIVDAENQIIFVSHADREDKAQKLAALIKENISCKDVVITMVGMGCGCNIGPGLICAYWRGNVISKDLSLEKKIYSDIKENL